MSNEFRVWDNEEKRYLDCTEAPMLGMNGELLFRQKNLSFATCEKKDRYLVEPSIDYLDIKKQLIYVGDIVECDDDYEGVYLIKTNRLAIGVLDDKNKNFISRNLHNFNIVGNVHDENLSDDALPFIYIVEKQRKGLFQWLQDSGWTINDIMKYKSGNDLFHDIVKKERKCAKQWYTDILIKLKYKSYDIVYEDDSGELIIKKKDKNNSLYKDSQGRAINVKEKTIHELTVLKINRYNCKKILDTLKDLYTEPQSEEDLFF